MSDPILLAKHVHFVGIGGIGVSAVAHALLGLGKKVTGSDQRESQITDSLRAAGAEVWIGHDQRNIVGADVVVRSSAVPDDNVELRAARARGVLIRHRSEALGSVLSLHDEAVGVMGTHGKGTVSAMVTWILEYCGRTPSFVIGALLENFGRTNARIGDRRIVVAEVDESDGSMRNMEPSTAVICNVEVDHLNYYRDLTQIQNEIIAALGRSHHLRRVIARTDCPGVVPMLQRLRALSEVTTFGLAPKGNLEFDFHAAEIHVESMRGSFLLCHKGEPVRRMNLAVPGAYNVANALGASAAALSLGVGADMIADALAEFRGLQNRFSIVEVAGRRIIKDYVSHPTAIRFAMEAAAVDPRPICVVFRPWRYTMMRYFMQDFAAALEGAAQVVLTEIDGGGEVPQIKTDSKQLAALLCARGCRTNCVDGVHQVFSVLCRQPQTEQQVLFFGGEDLFTVADAFARYLRGTE